MNWAAFIAGCMFGAVAGVTIGKVLARIRHRAPKPRKEAPQYHGHHWAPVPTLRKQLPTPPDSCAWEIKVDSDSCGDEYMHLSLVSVIDESVIAKSTVDLTVSRRTGKTFADGYLRWSSLMEETFQSEIIGPLVDFANREVRKRRPEPTSEYSMGA